MVKIRLGMWAIAVGLFAMQSAQGEAAVGPVPVEVVTTARTMVELMAKAEFDKAVKHFDATMMRVAPPEKVEKTWKSLMDQVGAFKKLVGVRSERAGKYDVVFVTCAFKAASLDVKVVLTRDGKITGYFFVPTKPAMKYQPPAYVDSKAFTETEVKVGKKPWLLPGTLSLPTGQGPFPAVVLVHGSGPNDRDESLGPNQMFRDLAWGLASRGIAVLRYEKRTREHAAKMASTKHFPSVKEEVIDDALAAAALLRHVPRVNARKIFVAGHSLGGMLLPQIGSQDAGLAGLISLAGSCQPLEDSILEQLTYIASLKKAPSEEEKAALDKLRKLFTRLKDPRLSRDTPAAELPPGVPASYWLELREYVPPKVAGKFKQPILILQGERDYQATMADFRVWRKTLAGRNNVRFKSYPRLNHQFIAGEGKIQPSEYEKPGHVDQRVIEDVAGWIRKLP